MGWFDDLADKVGFSSKSLGVNTAEDKAAREAAQLEELRNSQDQYQQILQNQSNANFAKDYDQRVLQGIINPPAPTQADNSPSVFSKMTDAFGKAMNSAALPGIIGAGSGILGYAQAAKNRDAADSAMQKATDLASQMNYLQDPEVAKIQDDAANKAAIQKALGMMSDRASMGLTPSDLADLEKIRNQQSQTFQAQQGKIQDDMARRGMAGSGMELAQLMGSAQAANQQAANNATDLSSQMFQAKQNAIQGLANMGNTNLTSQFTRDTTRANATDQVSQFNTNLQNQRNQAMQNAQRQMAGYQQQAGQNKAAAIGNLGQGVGTAVSAYQQSQKKDANGNPIK